MSGLLGLQEELVTLNRFSIGPSKRAIQRIPLLYILTPASQQAKSVRFVSMSEILIGYFYIIYKNYSFLRLKVYREKNALDGYPGIEKENKKHEFSTET